MPEIYLYCTCYCHSPNATLHEDFNVATTRKLLWQLLPSKSSLPARTSKMEAHTSGSNYFICLSNGDLSTNLYMI